MDNIFKKITKRLTSPLKYIKSLTPTDNDTNDFEENVETTFEQNQQQEDDGREKQSLCQIINVENENDENDEQLVQDENDITLPYNNDDNGNVFCDNDSDDNIDNDDSGNEENIDEKNNKIEDDELQAFLLRAKLSDMKFTHIWKVMPELGWKYNGVEYITPNGINLGNSRVAMERLDVYALSPLTMRERDHLTEDDDTHLDDKMKAIRTQLLTRIFTNLDPESRRFKLDCDDDNNQNNNKEKNMIKKQTKIDTTLPKKRKKRQQQQNTTTFVSATMNEPGTEQYLARKSRRLDNKQSLLQISQYKNDNDLGNDYDQQPKKKHHQKQEQEEKQHESLEKLIWPQPKENVEAIKQIRKNDSNKELDTTMAQISYNYLNDNISQWKFLLTTNHSLLFHGFGSKRILLERFGTELKSCGDVLTLNGHDSDITVSSILDVIVTLFLDGVEPKCEPSTSTGTTTSFVNNNNIVRRASLIAQTLGFKRDNPIYLLIHNIDGTELRSKDSQNALATLISHSHILNPKGMKKTKNDSATDERLSKQNERVIRLAATIDNVDAPMFLWDVNLLHQFSWIWKRTDTYYPYYNEVEMTISNETYQKKAFAKIEAIDYVFMEKVLKSIAPKHTEILKHLGELQLSKGTTTYNFKNNARSSNEKKYDYVSYIDWRQKCFGEMVVTKEADLKKMMSELIDHGIIELWTDYDEGRDYVCIPTTRSKVKDIVSKLHCK